MYMQITRTAVESEAERVIAACVEVKTTPPQRTVKVVIRATHTVAAIMYKQTTCVSARLLLCQMSGWQIGPLRTP